MKEGWKHKKLGEVCNTVTNIRWQNVPSDAVYTYVDLSAVDRDSLSIGNTIKVNKENAPSRAKQIIHANDVLFGTTRPTLKRVCLVNKEYNDSICSTGFCVLRANEKTTLSKWIYYQLLSNRFYSYIEPLQSGVSYPAVSDGIVKSYSIPIPPLSEQQHIVDELDLLSSIIGKKKVQLKELDNLAQSIFYEMFGDPTTNEKGWEVRKLKDCCNNYDSQRKPITAKDRIKGSIPYYGASGIVDYVKDFIFDGDFLLVSEDGANLVLRSTPIAFCIKGKTWVNNHAHVLKFETLFQQKYIEFSINLRDISMMVTGCAQPKLTQAALNNMIILYPPLSLQQQFATKIEALEHQKELIKKSIKEVETLFNSRMDYYFN